MNIRIALLQYSHAVEKSSLPSGYMQIFIAEI